MKIVRIGARCGFTARHAAKLSDKWHNLKHVRDDGVYMAQLQIQRTEIGMRRGRQPGSTKMTCPVSVFIADGPDQERSNEWVIARFNADARPDDQLSLIQLAVLQQARAAINDQIAVLEKRFGRGAGSTVTRGVHTKVSGTA